MGSSASKHYALVRADSAAKGSRLGHRLQAFKDDIDRPLAAILTLNTIAHTVGAIGVGDQAARIWADANPLITGLAVPAAMTLAILVLSELIPKTLGANHWQSLAPVTANCLEFIIRLLGPLVWLSQLITRKLKNKDVTSAFSRSDFVAMADIGAQDGVFEEQESEIITNLLKFRSVQAKDVMTPRTVVRSAPATETFEEFFESNREQRFSRIPLYENQSRDQVIGYVLKDQVLASIVDGHATDALISLKREIIAVPFDYPILELFNRFLSAREQIALVVDEFGGMDGIVTMEDVIETLLGVEIVDESDRTVDMHVLARRSWERRARRVRLSVEPSPKDETAEDNSESND